MNRQGSFQRNEQFYGLWFDTFCSVFKYSLFELSEYLKNSTAFSMKLKNLKGNYKNFYNIIQSHQYRLKLREMWDEMTELNYRKLCWENWKVFKEIFEAAVHSSDSISNIEKFTYLKTYLDKSALQAIEGFPLTNANYAAAWQLLDERYGNEQLIISCHMNNLIKLDPIIQPIVKEIRKLHDTIESNVLEL